MTVRLESDKVVVSWPVAGLPSYILTADEIEAALVALASAAASDPHTTDGARVTFIEGPGAPVMVEVALRREP